MSTQRIDQLLPSYAHFDAIGNHTHLVCELLRARGFESHIYAEQVHAQNLSRAYPLTAFKNYADPQQIVIYHHSVASAIPRFLMGAKTFNIMSYHNITPAKYFNASQDWQSYRACALGRFQIPLVKNLSEVFWTVSAYNRQELADYQIARPCLVFPVLRQYDRLLREAPNPALEQKLRTKKNLLFVGRLSPHKAQHDLMFYLRCVKEREPQTRLVLVGSGAQTYLQQLRDVAAALDLSLSQNASGEFTDADIVIFDHIKDSDLASCYRTATIFVCASEHEGFCVPLIEAMGFGLSVIAHSCTAVQETCRDGGILVDKFADDAFVNAILELLGSEAKRREIGERCKKQAATYSWENLKASFNAVLDETLRLHSAYDALDRKPK